MISVIRSVNGGDVRARRGWPWLDFVESEKESEMSETVREPRVKRKNTEKLTFVCP